MCCALCLLALALAGCGEPALAPPPEPPGEQVWKEIPKAENRLTIPPTVARDLKASIESGESAREVATLPMGSSLEVTGSFVLKDGELPQGTALIACYHQTPRGPVLTESRTAPDPQRGANGEYTYVARNKTPSMSGRFRLVVKHGRLLLGEREFEIK